MTSEHVMTTEEHSSIVGGSSAERRMRCPGSYQLEQQIPVNQRDDESSYAAEGTAFHEAVAYMLDQGLGEDDLDDMIGSEFYGHTLTKTQVVEGLLPAIQFFDKLAEQLEAADGGEFEFDIEARCEMPGIPNAFGTSDIIGRTPKRSIIVDWKFGAGVPVSAFYEEPIVPATPDNPAPAKRKRGNPQLMFYARAAMHSFPDLFEKDPDWKVELFIVQPRISEDLGPRYTQYTTTVKELEEFRMQLVKAIAEAKGDNPSVNGGANAKHCQWCAAKPICPRHTGPMLSLEKLNTEKALEPAATNAMDDDEYCALIGRILDRGEILDAIVKEAKQQAHQLIEDGFEIPSEFGEGWGLKPKRKGHDKWKDDEQAEKHLGNLGLSVTDRRVVKPITPAVARKELKKIGKKLKDEYVDFGTSSGYTLDRLENIDEPVKFLKQSEIAGQLSKLPAQE